MKTVEILQVIRTRLSREGEGTKESPVRIVEEYWDMEGNLIFKIDPFKKEELCNYPLTAGKV